MEKNPIIVALDGMPRKQAFALAESLKGLVWGFKANDLLHQSNGGATVVHHLHRFGNAFPDPKLYDIGNTVKNSLLPYVKAKADFVTISGEAWEPALRAAAKVKGNTKLLVVTLLSSLDEADVRKKYNYPLLEHPRRYPVQEEVLKLARLGKQCGLDGIVCSGQELQMLKDSGEFDDMIKVVPAIRPLWYQELQKTDDQKRTMMPKEALELGADFLVIGRPITEAEDPKEAVRKTLEEINQSMNNEQ